MDIYKLVGDKLRGNLVGLRQNQLEILEKEFDSVGGGGGGGAMNKSRSPSPDREEVITTNINHQGGGKGKMTKTNSKLAQLNKAPISGMTLKFKTSETNIVIRKNRRNSRNNMRVLWQSR